MHQYDSYSSPIADTSTATKIPDKFEALDELDRAPKMQAAAALSSWANKVSVRRSIKRERVRKPRSAEKTCANETELDEYLTPNPTCIAALPTEPNALAKLAKHKPVDTELGKDEQCFMLDSGAGTNGARCKKHFKDYKRQGYPANRPGPRCVAANGAPLQHGGFVKWNVVMGGDG